MVKKLLIPVIFLVLLLLPKKVLAADKRLEINLSTQRLQAFEGNTKFLEVPISSGLRLTPTPLGQFYPQRFLRFDTMAGVDYFLPNVPYVVYFSGGYAIHGAYWHTNFGQPMSHGCVNVSPANMAKIYSWLDKNTLINIYGQTPM